MLSHAMAVPSDPSALLDLGVVAPGTTMRRAHIL
jgi:hypothetical protein